MNDDKKTEVVTQTVVKRGKIKLTLLGDKIEHNIGYGDPLQINQLDDLRVCLGTVLDILEEQPAA